MAVKRIVSTSFWTDSKVDMFSPEDKYFMLYLLTNPHTTQLGIYELSVKHAAFELGYSQESVLVLLDRFETKYKIIKRSKETGEIAIKNYLKHSIVKGGKPVLDCLNKEANKVKDLRLLSFICKVNRDSDNKTVKEFIDSIKDNIPNYNDDDDNDNDNDNERIVPRIVESVPKVTVTSSAFADEFEKLWQKYPKKQGKKDALKKYVSLRKANKVDFDTVDRGIDNYVAYITNSKTDMKYVKQGSTFFNGECWKDEYEIKDNSVNVFDNKPSANSDYDNFMSGLQDFLKESEQ